MKEAVLVIIKPEGMSNGLVGNVIDKLAHTKLEIIAAKVINVDRKTAEKHYHHIKGQPFFEGVIGHFMGKYHKTSRLLSVIYYGDNAIKKCRKIAGATNPEEAHPSSIRGCYGRIRTDGIYENVVHVSSDAKEAKREITLWYRPEEITRKIYPTKNIVVKHLKECVWK